MPASESTAFLSRLEVAAHRNKRAGLAGRRPMETGRMSRTLRGSRVSLVPVAAADVDRITALLRRPDVRRFLCDDTSIARESVAEAVAESLDPASIAQQWIIEAPGAAFAGIVGMQRVSGQTMRLRAIGWRSLEVVIALDPACWGHGIAAEAIETVAGYALADGVTFALLGAVDVPNRRSHRLMARCGFSELGRVPGPLHELVVYERAL